MNSADISSSSGYEDTYDYVTNMVALMEMLANFTSAYRELASNH